MNVAGCSKYFNLRCFLQIHFGGFQVNVPEKKIKNLYPDPLNIVGTFGQNDRQIPKERNSIKTELFLCTERFNTIHLVVLLLLRV